MTLTWAAPLNNGGATVDTYKVERSSDGGVTWSTVASAVADVTYGDSGLTNGTTYLYRISATNTSGTGSSSAGVAAVPAALPGAATGLTATSGSGSVILSWSAPINNGGAAITGYMVESSQDGGTTWTTEIANTGSSAGYASVTNLTAGQPYDFRVSAINAAGTGAASASATGTPVLTSSVVLSGSTGNGQVTLTWTAPTDVTPTSYVVEKSTDGITWTSAMTNPGASDTTGTATGLTNGTMYFFRIQVITSGGPASSYSNYVSLIPRGAPGTVTGLATSAGDTQVTLRWTAPSSDGGTAITGYKVESSTNGTTWTVVTTSTGNQAVSYTVTGLTNATTYTFRVSAINVAGTGTASATATGTPFTTPLAPATLTATAGGSKVDLAWTAPSSNGGSSVTAYVVQRSDDGGATWTTLTSSETGLTYSAIGLTNGTTYAFRVAAVNAAGTGPSISPVAATPFLPPVAPTGVTATAGDSSVALSWTAPSNVAAIAIVGYKIERSVNSGSTWTVAVANTASNLTNYTVNGLTNGTTYQFRVSGIISSGAGAASTAVTVLPYGAPTAPTGVTVTAGDSLLDISWTAPGSNNGNAITGYTVEISSDGGATFTVAATVTTTSTQITGLTNGNGYVVRVIATNAAGNGLASSTVSGTPFTSPASPTSLAAIGGTNEVTLSWVAPTSTGGSTLIGYRIERSSNGGASWTTVVGNTGTNATAFTVGNLNAGVLYSFRVAAVTAGGAGSFSTVATASPVGLPTAPTAITATAGASSVTVAWQAPTSNGGNTVTAYVVERSADGGVTWTTLTSSVTALTYTATGLTNGTTYAFRVSAVSSSGAGISSSPASAIPYGAPGQALSLTALSSISQVVLIWSAPTSDGGAPINGYFIETSTDSGTTWTTLVANTGSPSTVYVASGLTNGTTYKFRVSAVNAFGSGTASSVATSVPSGLATAPRSVVATAGNGSVGLSWTAPSSAGGGTITGYRIDQSADGGATWTVAAADTATTSTSYSVTGLTNGTNYAYRIFAINGNGPGTGSAITSAVPFATPGQPASVTATGGNTTALITWSTPTSDGGSPITGYKVEQSTDGTTWTVVVSNTNSIGTSSQVAGLTNGTNYQFRVSAINVSGTGTASSAASAVPYAGPSAPTSLVATAASTQVTLSWTAASNTGGSALIGYKVEQSVDGGNTWTAVVTNTNSTATSYVVSGLTNGSVYAFRIAGINAAGLGATTAVVTAVPFAATDAPSAVTAVFGDTQATLTWTAPASTNGASVTGYTIESSTDAGGSWTTVVANTNTALVSYNATGLTNGTSYIFRVAAINAAGTSSFASSSTGTPAGIASAPTALAAVAGNTTASLTWTMPSSNGGRSITGYRIEMSTDGGVVWTAIVANSGSASTSYSHTGLTNGAVYSYRVSAITSVGVGVASTPANAQPAGAPAAATNLVASPGDSTAILSWTSPSSNGGSPITGYLVEKSTNGTTWTTAIANTATVVASTTVTGLTNGTLYHFRVAAINAIGTGTASTSTTTTPASVPNTPTSVSGTSGDTQATITWAAPSNNGGSAVTGYVVERSVDGINWTTLTSGALGTSYTSTGLTNGTRYMFRIAAGNIVGSGAYAPTVIITPASTPSAPSALVTTIASNTVALTWSVPASNGGLPITHYVVEQNDGSGWITVANNVLTTTYVATGLTNGTSYNFRISAANSVGVGASVALSSNVSPAGLPDAPTALAAVSGNGTATLTWGAPAATNGASIAGYRIEATTNGGTTWSTISTNATSGYTATGLTNGVGYVFRISAVDGSNTALASGLVSAVPSAVPQAPTGLSVAAGFEILSLSWIAPTNTGGSPITFYTVQISTNGTTWTTESTTVTGTNYSIVGLTNGTTYYVQVSVANINGSSSFTSSVAGTPNAGATPGAPTGLLATSGDAQVALTWTAPTSRGGSIITGYKVERSFDGGTTWSVVTANSGSSVTSYLVSGLANGTGVSFRVSAVNASGAGTASSAATTTPRAVASSPTSLTETAGNGHVVLAWAAPTSNGGTAVTSYLVERSSDSGATWTVVTTTSALTTDVTGLTNGTSYAFRVSAITGAGTGSPTTPIVATPFTTANAVTGITTIARNGQVTVSWTAPTNNGGAIITGYKVASSTDGGTTFSSDTLVTGTTAVVTGLTNGTPVVIRIIAVNAAGNGASATSTSVTPASTPGAPTSLSGAAGNAQATVTWSAPTSNGGSAVVSYAVETSTSLTGSWTRVGTTTNTTYTLTGLTNGAATYVRVLATNNIGDGVPSTPVIVNPATTASAPASVVVTAADRSATVTWTAPASDGGAVVTSYIVEKSTDGTNWVSVLSTTALETTLTGLQNGTQYFVRVSAVNAAGTGPALTASSSVVASAKASSPINLAITPGNATLNLSWSAPVSNGGSTITAYVVEETSDGGITWSTSSSAVVNGLTAVASGLTNGSPYSFRVRAVNSVGTGAASQVVSAVPFTTPSAPQNVVATPAEGQASITWNAPLSNGGASVTSYVVQQSADGGNTWTTVGTSVTTGFIVYGLTNGLSYQFRIYGVNAAVTNPSAIVSSGAQPSTAASTTPRTTASAPTAIASTAGDRQATVSWSAPINNGGSAITSYTVQRSVDGGRNWTTAATVNAPTTSATITGLTNGVAYVFRAYATNGAGLGAASTWVTTSPVAPPAAVASVTALALTGGATLQWTAPIDNGGAEIVGYVVQKSTDGGVTWVNATQIGPNLYDASAQSQAVHGAGAAMANEGGVVRSTALTDAGLAATTSVNFTGLQEGTSYAFRIKVYTVVGESPWAETRVTTGVTPTPVPPAPVPAPAPAPTPVAPKPVPAPTPVVKPAGVVTIAVAVDAQMVPTSKVMSISASNLLVGSTATVTLVATVGTKTVQKSLATRTIGVSGTLTLAAKLSATLPAGSYKLVVVGTGANNRTATSTAQFVIPASWSSVVEKLPEAVPTTTVPKAATTTVPKSNSGSSKTTTTTTLPTTATTTNANGSIATTTTVAPTESTIAGATTTTVVAMSTTTVPQDVVEVSISTGPQISTSDVVAVLGIGLLILLLILGATWFIAAWRRDDEEEEDVNV